MSNKILSLMGYDMPEDESQECGYQAQEVGFTNGYWVNKSDEITFIELSPHQGKTPVEIIYTNGGHRYVRPTVKDGDYFYQVSGNQIDWEEAKPDVSHNAQ